MGDAGGVADPLKTCYSPRVTPPNFVAVGQDVWVRVMLRLIRQIKSPIIIKNKMSTTDVTLWVCKDNAFHYPEIQKLNKSQRVCHILLHIWCTDSIKLVTEGHVSKLLLILDREINYHRWWRIGRSITLKQQHYVLQNTAVISLAIRFVAYLNHYSPGLCAPPVSQGTRLSNCQEDSTKQRRWYKQTVPRMKTMILNHGRPSLLVSSDTYVYMKFSAKQTL